MSPGNLTQQPMRAAQSLSETRIMCTEMREFVSMFGPRLVGDLDEYPPKDSICAIGIGSDGDVYVLVV